MQMAYIMILKALCEGSKLDPRKARGHNDNDDDYRPALELPDVEVLISWIDF